MLILANLKPFSPYLSGPGPGRIYKTNKNSMQGKRHWI